MEVSTKPEQSSIAAYGPASGNLTSIPAELLSTDQLTTISLYTCSIAIPVCIFGLVSNVVNIIVFYKIGLSTVSSICFFCLAITDFNCISYILVVAFAYHPILEHDYLPISMQDVLLMNDTVYYGFSAMGSWITAIINMERSCCVVFPLKVKLIFTRKTTVWLLGGMAIYQVATGLPRNFVLHLTSVISPVHNRSVLVFDYERFNAKIFTTSVFASYSIPTVVFFIVVLVGTIFLINRFKQSRRLRDAMTGSGKPAVSNKDAKLIRMVIFICSIYIVSASPLVLLFIGPVVYPDFTDTNPYLRNVFYASHFIADLFQAFSSSINIVVYFKMGSKYKDMLKQMFFCNSK